VRIPPVAKLVKKPGDPSIPFCISLLLTWARCFLRLEAWCPLRERLTDWLDSLKRSKLLSELILCNGYNYQSRALIRTVLNG
jgi:hypothetical protein